MRSPEITSCKDMNPNLSPTYVPVLIFVLRQEKGKKELGSFLLCFSKGLIFVLTQTGIIAFFEISNIFTGMRETLLLSASSSQLASGKIVVLSASSAEN